MDFEEEYKRIYQKLVKQLDKDLSDPKFYDKKGIVKQQRKLSLLRQIKNTLEETSAVNKKFSSSLQELHKISIENTIKRYDSITGNKVLDDWSYIEPKDIKRLKSAYINEMEQAQNKYFKSLQTNLDLAEKESKKIIGELARKETADVLIGGELKKQSIINMTTYMKDIGMTSFIYNTEKGARKMSLENYAKIQINSKIGYAVNTGIIQANEELGNDLVQFSVHYTCCKICGTYAEVGGVGRIYTTNSERADYPQLKTVPGFSGNYGIIHINCKHRISAYFEEYVENNKRDKEVANLPFKDYRSEAQVKKYDNQQKLNTYRLAKKRNIEQRKELENAITEKDKSKYKRLQKSSKTINNNIKEIKKEL